jgi:hypothetical protein
MLQILDRMLPARDILLGKLVNDTIKCQAPLVLLAGCNRFYRLGV